MGRSGTSWDAVGRGGTLRAAYHVGLHGLGVQQHQPPVQRAAFIQIGLGGGTAIERAPNAEAAHADGTLQQVGLG